jgi:hypothetical protein
MALAIVSREDELARLRGFVGWGEEGPAALVIDGEAGIGKSTLWLAGVDLAREAGMRVLSSRPAEDCSPQTFSAGQSFYETAANPFTVKNESKADAVVLVTFVVPGGTPTTGLRTDRPQPTSCAK